MSLRWQSLIVGGGEIDQMKYIFKLYISTAMALSLAFLSSAANASDKYVCIIEKASNINPVLNDEPWACDFVNEVYLGITKMTCKNIFSDRVIKLEIRDDALLYFDTTRTIKLYRHDHRDGITGVGLSSGQYQTIVIYAPKTQRLAAVKLNPFLGATTHISRCIKS